MIEQLPGPMSTAHQNLLDGHEHCLPSRRGIFTIH